MIIIENNKVAAEKLINKSTKLKDLEKTEYFQKFYELDPTSKRYPDNPKFLITLIKWFLEDPIERQYNLIKLEFETYLEQVRLNHWKAADVVIKDIAKFPKFQDFATEVHRITAKYRKSDSQEQSDEIKDLGSKIEVLGKKIDKKDVTLQKDEVVVVRADTMQKSIEYGSGFSDWCTARTSGNYFYEYRFGNYGDVGESTMYYVYFPKRYSEDPSDSLSVLHFGANEDGKISYTDRTNTESVESLSWLKNQFDEFKGVNMEEVFPHKPITDSERKVRDLPDEMTDDDFYKLSNEDKLMYLQSSSDRYINLNKFKSMSDDLKSSYLGIAENSQLLLAPSVLNLIKNTSYGRRYIKGMHDQNLEQICANIINANDRMFENRQSAVELINSIVENKKDNITPRGLYNILHASFQHKSSFDKNTFLKTVNTFGKSKLSILLPDYIYHLITDFTFFGELPLIEEVLGKENINKLTVRNITQLLGRVSTVVDRDPIFCVDMVNFIIKYFGEVDNISSTLISTISELSERPVPIVNKQTLLFKLIDLRPSLSTSFVTSVLTHSIGTKLEVLNYIGDRFDINRLSDEEINKIFTTSYVKPENLIDFEKSLGRLLPKLSLKNIAQTMMNLRPESTMQNEVVDLLIKYTINNWTSELFQILLTTISQTDEQKIKYINIVGIDRLHNKLTSKSLYDILESSFDPVSIIDILGVDYVRASLVKEDFKRLLVKRKVSKDAYDKLINFLIKYFDLTSEDVAFLFQTGKNPSRIKDLVGSINFEKLEQKDLLSILTNPYLDNIVYENLFQLFKDKILQFTPDQINDVLNRSRYTLSQTVNFLSENNYNFTNDQIVTILSEASIYARMGSIPIKEVLQEYFNKIGVDKIRNLDNQSIVKLLKSGFHNIEFLFSYVPINSLDAPTIVEILKLANTLSYGVNVDSKTFEKVFTMLESVLNKLNQLDTDKIVDLMRTGHEPSTRLFDYIIKKNPSMLTPSLIRSLLRGLIDSGVYKYHPSFMIEQIGAEKINKALDELPESKVSDLIDKDNFTEFNISAVYALVSIMSPSNLGKINDNVFSQLVRSFGFTSGRTSDFSVFLKKPNLTSSNIVQLIQYAPEKFYKNNLLESLKPQLNKLTPEEILIPLTSTYYYNIALSRLTRIINFLGKTTIDRLSGDDIFSILNQTRYDPSHEAVFKLLLSLGENLYKLSQIQIDSLYSSGKFFKKYDIEMASFCKTKQISERFANQIRESNYVFLLDFGVLYFDNFKDVTDYLKVISQYIQTHNNTLTFREFSAIVDTIENVRSVRNAILTFLSKVLKGTFKTYWKQYQDALKRNDKPITEYKRFYSDLLLENSPFSQENLEKALDIERKAYPPHMQLINSYVEDGGTLDIYDIADYLECGLNDIVFHMGSNWFIIGCVDGNELEIADWASDGGMSPNAIKAFFGVLRQYKGKTISCSARETTSYSLIKKAERVGYVTVLEEEKWNWGGVNMVDMKFKFNDDFMNKLGKK